MDNKQEFALVLKKLKNHPSSLIRAEYLIRFENQAPDSSGVKKLRQSACNEEPLKSILDNRNDKGWWYTPTPGGIYKKYQGTVWTLLFSAELGAPSDLPALKESCNYFMEQCYIDKTGAFSSNRQPSHTIPCFVAHACYFLTYFGFFYDERVQKAFQWLANNLGQDHGMKCIGMDSSLNPTCIMALPKFLKAATLLNEEQRKNLLGDSVDKSLNKLLKVNLDFYQPVEVTQWNKEIIGKRIKEIRKMKEEWKLSGRYKQKQSWSKFQFPLHYDSDLIEVLLCFGRLGINKNKVLEDSARRVYNARGKDGYWHSGRSLKGKMWADLIEEDDWISLRALEVLSYY